MVEFEKFVKSRARDWYCLGLLMMSYFKDFPCLGFGLIFRLLGNFCSLVLIPNLRKKLYNFRSANFLGLFVFNIFCTIQFLLCTYVTEGNFYFGFLVFSVLCRLENSFRTPRIFCLVLSKIFDE